MVMFNKKWEVIFIFSGFPIFYLTMNQLLLILFSAVQPLAIPAPVNALTAKSCCSQGKQKYAPASKI
jgi:hypothetical protein